MSISSDGIIAYGYNFPEGFEFPWGNDDIIDWWIDTVHGYKPPFKVFTATGDYLAPKPPQSRIDEYFAHRRNFADALPKLDVEMVIHCSFDYSMYIMAIPGTNMSVCRGYPEPIPDGFIRHDPEWDRILADFCNKYDIKIPGDPSWWLTSLYG